MRRHFPALIRSAPFLMLTAVALYSIYPPLTNLLLNNIPPLFLAFTLHSFAFVATFAYVLLNRRYFRFFANLVLTAGRGHAKLFGSLLLSGILICANHILFYLALKQSDKFDVTAILVFETWPVIFFLIDTAFVRRSKLNAGLRDYLLVFVTFFGFLTLMAQEIDLVDWILFDNKVVTVAALSAAGGVAMALNTFARRMAMLALSDVAGQPESPPIDGIGVAMLVELMVRIVAAVLLFCVYMLSNEPLPHFGASDLTLAFVVGALGLGLGSAIYDLAIYKAPNAAITALWYLMPVGSLVLLAVLQNRFVNQYEMISLIMIVSANILISLRNPLTSSFNLLYVATLTIGLSCIFLPHLSFGGYFDIVSVATIFYALLVTYALAKVSETAHEKEMLLLRLRQNLRRSLGRADSDEDRSEFSRFSALILSIMKRKPRSTREHYLLQKRVTALKNRLDATTNGSAERQALFDDTDRLTALAGEKLSGGEYVVLFMLALTNVLVIVFLRNDDLIFDLFAFTLAVAASYLFLLVLEQDRRPLLRIGQYLSFLEIRRLARSAARRAEPGGAGNTPGRGKEEDIQNRLDFAPSLLIFSFVFLGFTYAIAYNNLATIDRPEETPSGLTAQELRSHVGIGAPSWPSARMKAEVLKAIAAKYLSLNVDLYPRSNQAIFDSMGSAHGVIDVHPEVWAANVPDLIRRYVTGLKTVRTTGTTDTGKQGLCINEPARRRIDLTDITELGDPAVATLFDLDGDGRGEMWLGAEDWASTGIERNRSLAYGFGKEYDGLVFSETLFLRALEHYDRIDQPFLFFCYTPHFVIDKFDAAFVPEGGFKADAWQGIVEATKDPAALPDRGTPWPQSDITIAYSARLDGSDPNFVRLLKNFIVPDTLLSDWTYRMVVAGEDPAAIATEWVDGNEEQVLEWLLPQAGSSR